MTVTQEVGGMRSPRPPGWWQCLLPLGDYRPPTIFSPLPFCLQMEQTGLG